MASLVDILTLSGGGVVSIVGAGGKTTLMDRISREIACRGETVLVTTTTKILMPRGNHQSPVIISSEPADVLDQAESLLARSPRLTAAGSYLPEQDKLVGFQAEEIDTLAQSGRFQWIIVEADGANHRPLKAPASYEPVIPASSHWVVAVVGLDVMGRPLTEEWVFRSRLFADLTGLTLGEKVTAQAVAITLTHEAGMMKGAPSNAVRCAFLNKADTKGRREAGREIIRCLRDQKGKLLHRAIIGALEHEEEPLERYDIS